MDGPGSSAGEVCLSIIAFLAPNIHIGSEHQCFSLKTSEHPTSAILAASAKLYSTRWHQTANKKPVNMTTTDRNVHSRRSTALRHHLFHSSYQLSDTDCKLELVTQAPVSETTQCTLYRASAEGTLSTNGSMQLMCANSNACTRSINPSINQSKYISIVPNVASESEVYECLMMETRLSLCVRHAFYPFEAHLHIHAHST